MSDWFATCALSGRIIKNSSRVRLVPVVWSPRTLRTDTTLVALHAKFVNGEFNIEESPRGYAVFKHFLAKLRPFRIESAMHELLRPVVEATQMRDFMGVARHGLFLTESPDAATPTGVPTPERVTAALKRQAKFYKVSSEGEGAVRVVNYNDYRRPTGIAIATALLLKAGYSKLVHVAPNDLLVFTAPDVPGEAVLLPSTRVKHFMRFAPVHSGTWNDLLGEMRVDPNDTCWTWRAFRPAKESLGGYTVEEARAVCDAVGQTDFINAQLHDAYRSYSDTTIRVAPPRARHAGKPLRDAMRELLTADD